MSQIEELQSRITAAMARIGTGLETLAAQHTGSVGPDSDLLEELQAEKRANAQLQDHLRRIRARHEAHLEQLTEDFTVQTDIMARLDMDLQRLRQANEQLRASNAELRKANKEGVGDPALINKAMLAEIEALRASQAADRAETSAILGRLDALLSGAAIATEDEEETA